MGILKKIIDESIKNISYDGKDYKIYDKFGELKEQFSKDIGKSFLWYNHNSKKLTLVEIVKPYDRYVIVEQTILNLDKEEMKLSHSISYSYLCSNLDRLYELEGEER